MTDKIPTVGLKRSDFVAVGAAGLAYRASGSDARVSPMSMAGEHASDEPYKLTTTSGIVFGSLRISAKVPQLTVVLIVAGSGPTDRNGNGAGLRTDTYRLLADAFETRGIATLR